MCRGDRCDSEVSRTGFRLVIKYGGTIGYRAGDGVLVFFNDSEATEIYADLASVLDDGA